VYALLPARETACGLVLGVPATQLLNAGCKITSIQQQLGHRKLDSTLIYARVHDETVASDYYAAMQRIEKSLEISAESEDVKEPMSLDMFTHAHLLNLIDQLAAPQLEVDARLNLIEQMRGMLKSQSPAMAVLTT
jgi:hypothetical protein